MTLFLVKYNGIYEVEAPDRETAEKLFEDAAGGLMEGGFMGYRGPVTEDEFEEDD